MHSNPYFFYKCISTHTHTLSIQHSSQNFHPIIQDKSQRRFLSLAAVVKPSLLYSALPCISCFGYTLTLLAL